MTLAALDAFLADYFEALHTQDLDLFDRVFHPGSTLYSQQDGSTVIRPFAEYRQMVADRASPASLGQPREQKVLMVDMLSEHMAVARVRLRLFDSIMEDHLNLVLTDAGWRIIAKTFTRVGPAT